MLWHVTEHCRKIHVSHRQGSRNTVPHIYYSQVSDTLIAETEGSTPPAIWHDPDPLPALSTYYQKISLNVILTIPKWSSMWLFSWDFPTKICTHSCSPNPSHCQPIVTSEFHHPDDTSYLLCINHEDPHWEISQIPTSSSSGRNIIPSILIPNTSNLYHQEDRIIKQTK